MEVFLTPPGLLLIFGPAAIVLTFIYFKVEVVKKHIVYHFRNRPNSEKYTRFPLGFETKPLQCKSKHDVWVLFFPGVNIFILVGIVFEALRTLYHKKCYQADKDEETGVIF